MDSYVVIFPRSHKFHQHDMDCVTVFHLSVSICQISAILISGIADVLAYERLRTEIPFQVKPALRDTA